MNELERTTRLKRPAEVTTYDTRPVIMMAAPYHRKADLAAAVLRQARRGEVRPLQARPSYNSRTGEWEIPVLRLRDPAPAWIKPAVITTGILAGIGTLGALGWWMVTSLATLPLGLFLAAAFAALLLIARSGRTPTVNITQNVTVKR
jgi:hypothetical protein